MAVPAFHVLSLFSGVGGLDLGLRLAVPNARVVAYVEREAYAAATLVARMADGALDDAPIWDDVTTFDGRPWRGVVDCIAGGFPCQPWSVAGARRGTQDERWLWDDIARLLREVEPGWVFLENVPGLLLGGLEHVLRDLAALGFAAEWGVLGAADAGAPHRRERLFILANAAGERPGETGRLHPGSPIGIGRGLEALADAGCAEWRRQDAGRGAVGRIAPTGSGGRAGGGVGQANAPLTGLEAGREGLPERVIRPLADAEPGGCERWHAQGRGASPTGAPGVGRVADATRHGRREGRAESERRWPEPTCTGVPLWPPGPADVSAWRAMPADLEPTVCRMADGLAARVDRLRATGNGVVPVVAALAFLALYERLAGAEVTA